MTTQIKRGILNQRNQFSDPDLIAKYRALYAGGNKFRQELDRFFCPNPNEPLSLTQDRKKAAFYIGYVGPIVDFFASMLFSAPMEIRSETQADDFYSEFQQDADGSGMALADLMRGAFTEALTTGTAWLRGELPPTDGQPAANLADYQARGLGRATLALLPSENVLDWETDGSGQLLWVCLYSCAKPRPDPRQSRNLIVETWTILDAKEENIYSFTYDPDKTQIDDDTLIPLIHTQPHGFPRVPLICIRPCEALWVLNRTADAQIEHFKLSNAEDWAILRTCYPTPVFNLEDKDSPPVMSKGSGVMLGLAEKFGFMSPDVAPFDLISDRVASLKDEIYRVSNQMALGVNNNAAAMGRSGDSKQADAAATKVCLMAYADMVKDAIEEVMELVSDARGDLEVIFSVEGMDSFDLSDTQLLVSIAQPAAGLVPSATFKTELACKVAAHVLPDLPRELQDKIRAEIEAQPEPTPTTPPSPHDDEAPNSVKDDATESKG